MPRFHFHLHEEDEVEDDEGLELPDLAAAMAHALESARDIACANIVEHRTVDLDHFVEVTDGEGTELFRVTFRDAFEVRG